MKPGHAEEEGGCSEPVVVHVRSNRRADYFYREVLGMEEAEIDTEASGPHLLRGETLLRLRRLTEEDSEPARFVLSYPFREWPLLDHQLAVSLVRREIKPHLPGLAHRLAVRDPDGNQIELQVTDD